MVGLCKNVLAVPPSKGLTEKEESCNLAADRYSSCPRCELLTFASLENCSFLGIMNQQEMLTESCKEANNEADRIDRSLGAFCREKEHKEFSETPENINAGSNVENPSNDFSNGITVTTSVAAFNGNIERTCCSNCHTNTSVYHLEDSAQNKGSISANATVTIPVSYYNALRAADSAKRTLLHCEHCCSDTEVSYIEKKMPRNTSIKGDGVCVATHLLWPKPLEKMHYDSTGVTENELVDVSNEGRGDDNINTVFGMELDSKSEQNVYFTPKVAGGNGRKNRFKDGQCSTNNLVKDESSKYQSFGKMFRGCPVISYNVYNDQVWKEPYYFSSEKQLATVDVKKGSHIKYTPLRSDISFQTSCGKMFPVIDQTQKYYNLGQSPSEKRSEMDNIDNNAQLNQRFADYRMDVGEAEEKEKIPCFGPMNFITGMELDPAVECSDKFKTNRLNIDEVDANKENYEHSYSDYTFGISSTDTTCRSYRSSISAEVDIKEDERGDVTMESEVENSTQKPGMTANGVLEYLGTSEGDFSYKNLCDIPQERLHMLLTKLQQQKAEIRISARENCFQQLQDILNRISLEDDKRLADKGVEKLIEVARAYVATFNEKPESDHDYILSTTSQVFSEMTGAREAVSASCRERKPCLCEENNRPSSSNGTGILAANAFIRKFRFDYVAEGKTRVDSLTVDGRGIDFNGVNRNEFEVTDRECTESITCSSCFIGEKAKNNNDETHGKNRKIHYADRSSLNSSFDTQVESLTGHSHVQCNQNVSILSENGKRPLEISSSDGIVDGRNGTTRAVEECSKLIGNCRCEDSLGEEKAFETDKPQEDCSQDMELVADALLSLSECLPSSSNEGNTIESFRPVVREFYQIEEAKIYRRRLCDLIEKERKSKGNANKERLQVFREKKLEEIEKKIGAIVKEKKTEIDLKFSFEISLMSESFRQELWLRIQKCICGKVGQLSCCSQCRNVFYCSKRCQVVDSDEHEQVCSQRRKL
ncbi:uncharacterized protein LOC135683038 [Rhopilema esculentum]|uniref:uncharacterized protein LOC135683038 n=1 Tax=Rhopilema esculentum TaxID=499914 RepID=UPI0031E26145|eukprot:gene15377-6611_t